MENMTHQHYMQLALQLAERGLWSTAPNPRVGCLFVKDDKILAQGWHRLAGHSHAEVEAIRAAKTDLKNSTCYVTLEPCCHQGKTAPCVEQLIAAGVKQVICATLDPNPQVAGQGLARLRQAGIETSRDIMKEAALALNIGFFKRMQTGRPYVRVKIAASLDGKVALANGQSQWITGESARADGHDYRARSDALITGVGTINQDNPRLNARPKARSDYETLQPLLRIIVDSHGRIRPDAKVLQDGLPTRVLTLAEQNIAGPQCDMAKLLDELGQTGHNEVLVEAGPQLTTTFLQQGLFDEILLYVAPKFLGQTAIDGVKLPALSNLAEAESLQFSQIRQLGDDCCLQLIKRDKVNYLAI